MLLNKMVNNNKSIEDRYTQSIIILKRYVFSFRLTTDDIIWLPWKRDIIAKMFYYYIMTVFSSIIMVFYTILLFLVYISIILMSYYNYSYGFTFSFITDDIMWLSWKKNIAYLLHYYDFFFHVLPPYFNAHFY